MSIIPLDFQRRCEQRWAARFLRPMPTTPQRQFERQDQKAADQIQVADYADTKPWVEATGYRPHRAG
jgi:hypothetical protein